jgi:hypothetical protein
MRLGWRIGLPGPFSIGGTLWRSKRRRPRKRYFYGYLADGSHCPHHHTRVDTAQACTRKNKR